MLNFILLAVNVLYTSACNRPMARLPTSGRPSMRFHTNPRLAAGAAAAARGMLSIGTCPQSQGAAWPLH